MCGSGLVLQMFPTNHILIISQARTPRQLSEILCAQARQKSQVIVEQRNSSGSQDVVLLSPVFAIGVVYLPFLFKDKFFP